MKIQKKKIIKTTIWFLQCILIIIGVINVASWICRVPNLAEKGSDIPGYAQVLVAVIAAMMIIIQLNQEKELEEQQNEIEESKLILQFNQSFIQDAAMCKAEAKLEEQFVALENGKQIKKIVKNKNRGIFTNYLVYLESLCMFIKNKQIRIEKVDDLMAYRFFIATNNKELQREEICSYPEYYRACIKTHNEWRKYRLCKGYSIPNEIWGLELWEDYEKYIDCKYTIHVSTEKGFSTKFHTSEMQMAARIIFESDKEFYRTLLENAFNVCKVIIQEAHKNDNMTMYYALDKNKVVGVSIVFAYKESKTDENTTKECSSYFDPIEGGFKEYYRTISAHIKKTEDCYIMCLCVDRDKKYEFERIDEIVLKRILKDNEHKNIYVNVPSGMNTVDENVYSFERKLYEKYGFNDTEQSCLYAKGQYVVMKKDAANK